MNKIANIAAMFTEESIDSAYMLSKIKFTMPVSWIKNKIDAMENNDVWDLIAGEMEDAEVLFSELCDDLDEVIELTVLDDYPTFLYNGYTLEPLRQ